MMKATRYRQKWNRLRNVRAGEWILLAKMSGMLGAVLVLQKIVSLPTLVSLFDPVPNRSDRLRVSPQRLIHLVNNVVCAGLRDSYCMKRSLLLFHFLRRWGYDARVYFGVVKAEGALKGHAWVNLDGAPVAEWRDPRERFTVTYSYPQAD